MKKKSFRSTMGLLIFLCLLINSSIPIRGHACDVQDVTDMVEPSNSQYNYCFWGGLCDNLLVKITWISNASLVYGYIMSNTQLHYVIYTSGSVYDYIQRDVEGYIEFTTVTPNDKVNLVFVSDNPSDYGQINYTITYEMSPLTFFNQYWYLIFLIGFGIIIIVYYVKKSRRTKLYKLLLED